jgi:16S rRNA (uracil1498-N3)-methyltransferase
MQRYFVDKTSVVKPNIYITGDDLHHIKNVMRLNVGDSIVVVCGDEYDYYATITDMKKGETVVVITDKKENPYNPVHNVTVFQALTKTDNMQLIVQKLTELGVTTFYPVITEFITSKDKMGKSDKLQVVSNQSIKQCKRSVPMLIENVIKFKDMVDMLSDYDIVFFANETEKLVSLQDKLAGVKGKVAIIVGSEGGFSESEIDALKLPNVHSVSLGKRILRAETASIALTSVIMYAIGEWNV